MFSFALSLTKNTAYRTSETELCKIVWYRLETSQTHRFLEHDGKLLVKGKRKPALKCSRTQDYCFLLKRTRILRKMANARTQAETYELGHLVELKSKDTNKDRVMLGGLESRTEGASAGLRQYKNND